MDESVEVTDLLNGWAGGDPEAAEAALLETYDRLRAMARSQLRGPADRELQTTELVHEAYLRLGTLENVRFRDRGHFLALTTRVMRRVLVDLARHRGRAKRDAGHRVTAGLLPRLPDAAPPAETVLAVDRALHQLSSFDAVGAQIVELKFFAGLTMPEISHALGVSEATANRRWREAKDFLLDRLPRAA